MSGTLQKVFRDGSWWAERPDGSWVRWDEAAQTWQAAAPTFALAATPPPPPAVATVAAVAPAAGLGYAPTEAADEPMVDATFVAPEQVYVEYGDPAPVWLDALRVYGFLFGAAVVIFGVIAFAFRGDPGMILTTPSPREIISGTWEPPPSPYLYIGIALGIFGVGVLWLKRRGNEEWWPVQLAVLGLGMAAILTVLTNVAGFHSGFNAMRFIYQWTAFLAVGWAFMQFRAWRRW